MLWGSARDSQAGENVNDAIVRDLTKTEFEQMLNDYREALENPEAAQIFIAMCGSNETAQAFAKPRGVGIGEFSKLVDLPVTTVRHYVELGLVNPFSIYGKFRFLVFNVPQIESVRQWRDLGLSLEEIVERRRNLGENVLLKEIMPNPFPAEDNDGQTVLQVMQIDTKAQMAQHTKEANERRKRGEPGIVVKKEQRAPGTNTDFKDLKAELQLEYSAALEKLEAKKLELEKRIARAKLMSEQLKSSEKPSKETRVS
jgi:DNA-binding transcriptional MerR regulator